MIKWGGEINILSTIPEAHLVVENYWFCQMIIEWEGIMNYQFGRIQNIELLELDLPNNILL